MGYVGTIQHHKTYTCSRGCGRTRKLVIRKQEGQPWPPEFPIFAGSCVCGGMFMPKTASKPKEYDGALDKSNPSDV